MEGDNKNYHYKYLKYKNKYAKIKNSHIVNLQYGRGGFALVLFVYQNGTYTSYHITICSVASGNSNILLSTLESKYSKYFTGKKYKLQFTNWLNQNKPGSIVTMNQDLENVRKSIFNDVQNNNNYQINASRYPNTGGYPPQHIDIGGNLNNLGIFGSNGQLGSYSEDLEFRLGIIGGGAPSPVQNLPQQPQIIQTQQPQVIQTQQPQAIQTQQSPSIYQPLPTSTYSQSSTYQTTIPKQTSFTQQYSPFNNNNNNNNINNNNNTIKNYKMVLKIFYNTISRPGYIKIIEFKTTMDNINTIKSIITDCNNKFFYDKIYTLMTRNGKNFDEQFNKKLIVVKSFDGVNNIGINNNIKSYIYRKISQINNVQDIIYNSQNLELVLNDAEINNFENYFGFTHEINNISYELILME